MEENLTGDFERCEDRTERDRRAETFSAVVLAGAYGWGSARHLHGLPPRPLAPVALVPVIAYVLRWLSEAGAREIAVCGGAFTAGVRHAIGDIGHDSRLSYHADPMPRGSAGCIRDAALSTGENPIVAVEATVVPNADLPRLVREHRLAGAAMSVVACPDTSSLTAPPRPAGIFILERRVIDLIRAFGYQDLKESLIPELHDAAERVAMLTIDAPCPKVVSVESYLAVNQWVVQRLTERDALPAEWQSWTRHADAIVHPSAEVAQTARLIGSVLVGRRARILDGATIVGPSVIGDDATVGREGLVSRSVVGRASVIGQKAVVHGSVLAEGARIDEHAMCHESVAPASPRSFVRSPSRVERSESAGRPAVPPATDVPVLSLSHSVPARARTRPDPDKDVSHV